MKKDVKKFKVMLIVMVIVLLVVATAYLIPIMKDISTQEGQLAFKQKIDDAGIFGILILFGLQLAQIFLVILPGEPLEVLAGMCYGTVGGTIFIFVSVFIITSIIFYLVRKFKKKFIYEFFSKEKIDKIENSKIFKNSKTIEIIFAILFLIPGTPKDLLVYIGALSPIKPMRFILLSTFARFPSVISSTMVGENLSFGNWKTSLIIYLVTFIITIAIIFIVNKFDKNKITKDALETIK